MDVVIINLITFQIKIVRGGRRCNPFAPLFCSWFIVKKFNNGLDVTLKSYFLIGT
jgi:hypothetical protein